MIARTAGGIYRTKRFRAAVVTGRAPRIDVPVLGATRHGTLAMTVEARTWPMGRRPGRWWAVLIGRRLRHG